MRILTAVILRFPGAGSSAQGQSDPKLRPKGVGDGQQVNIPVLPNQRLSDGVTQEARPAVFWFRRSKHVGSPGR